MHIYWDVKIKYPEKVENFGNEAKELMNTTISFLEQRFKPLENEIEEEWELNRAWIELIMLNILENPNEEFKIAYHNFSETLRTKMEDSLKDHDWEYMNVILFQA